jgi:hypothetical protein
MTEQTQKIDGPVRDGARGDGRVLPLRIAFWRRSTRLNTRHLHGKTVVERVETRRRVCTNVGEEDLGQDG